ncbi:MAG: hypothetical protein QOE84_576, partial [Actinomycetota bacterium]|nr:hypothetical protein [Actinomycetota bacterium]
SLRHVPLVAVVLAAATVLAAGGRVLLSLRDLRSLAESRRQALTDDLTGLANRRMFNRQLTATLAACAARPEGEDTRIAVLLIDMDRFKEINDSFGHPVGDEVLREIAERLRPGLRSSDLLARLGGDEFALLLDGSDTEYANGVAKRLTAELEQPFPLAQASFELGASIGIARYPDDATDAAELLRCADVAMYRAKAAKVAYTVYDHAHDDSRDRFELVADLRRAIEQRKLTLHYQPQLDLDTGLVIGVEALARWTHPALGAIGPDEFIPLAEASGLMGPLTSSVLRQALVACKGWQRRAPNAGVAVNVSADTVLDPAFVTEVGQVLASVGVHPRLLTLELTEGVVVADPGLAAERMGELRALGVKISVDDFGTGYSSLTYLKGLPVDEVKIDKGFIAGLVTDAADRAVVRGVVDIAHTLGLRVVAEGVEEIGQHELLQALGVDEVQGYLHARPMPAAAMVQWLRHRQQPAQV